MKALCLRAQIEPLGYHALRRFGATILDDGKTPVPTISALLGHTSTRVTDRYISVLDESLRDAVERLTELEPAQTRLKTIPPKSPRKRDSGRRKGGKVAERVGFEPTDPYESHDFESSDEDPEDDEKPPSS